MAGEPVLIRRTNTVEQANIIVAWLEERGVEVTVPDRDNPGVLAFGLTDVEGIEIYAAGAETAERARTLLAEHDKEHAAGLEAAEVPEKFEVKCEDCGKVSSFSGEAFGSVQECPECGGYLDMPGTDLPEAGIADGNADGNDG